MKTSRKRMGRPKVVDVISHIVENPKTETMKGAEIARDCGHPETTVVEQLRRAIATGLIERRWIVTRKGLKHYIQEQLNKQ